MILKSISSHRRTTAFLLFMVFYFESISPLMAMGNKPVDPYSFNSFSGGKLDHRSIIIDNGNNFSEKNIDAKKQSVNLFEPSTISENNFKIEKKEFIDGPGQPEMKSFQSVNGNNMVDLFTGDFSYSIPLLDVGGYPISIHYGSGITMDQEASWVGLGWNINPGTISRSMRGLPDDFDGVNDSLKKVQHIKDNKTTGVTIEPSLEIFGGPINVSARLGVFYNTYNGYGLETGVGIGGTATSAFGSLTGNLSISNNSQEGIRISPSLSASFGRHEKEDDVQGTLGISTGYSSRGGITELQINGGVQSSNQDYRTLFTNPGANYPLASISFARRAYTPSITMPITNTAYSFTGKIGGELWGVDPSAAFTGYVNKQSIAPEDITQKMPAAGYLYSFNANGRENVILDYNRQNEQEYNYKTTPAIAIPQYTYDAFSISGEGTGGSFRPYRGDVGYVFDHAINTRSSSTNGSIDVGLGSIAHTGLEITNIETSNANHRWTSNNAMEPKLRFQSSDTTYEAFYFRNPGEKTTNAKSYYRAIGDDSLIRIKLSGGGENARAENVLVKYDDEGKPNAELPVTETLVKKQRDKRTQTITYLTAADASVLGLDKQIRIIEENFIPVGNCPDSSNIKEVPRVDDMHKKNHLSEIDVLNSDGRRYVYGIPIYNALQKDVTFSVDTIHNDTLFTRGLTKYQPGDNTPGNQRGKDGYYSSEEMPGYAHNFLLTGILSPDYNDLTGNGISEDDPGDAVKFNYSRVYGADKGYYQWRIPFDSMKANYNEGFKSYIRDDKASYLYGKKEMWYLNSVESKTMIAVFNISTSRKDAWSSAGENGGADKTKTSRRLERIDLYVKADLVKNGIVKAKPVKSVHFEYTHELCMGSLPTGDSGKLTLKSIYFTYNKNKKGKLNPYVFTYHSENPHYNPRQTDRWGSYKNPASNPDAMSNVDFPYSTAKKDSADKYAGAWNLTGIRLPSGGNMAISYEADDYAYVQDKRATRMFTIAGINGINDSDLYNRSTGVDYYRIYIQTQDEIHTREDIKRGYMDIGDVLYFKFAVKMPKDDLGMGYDMVPGYATVKNYGRSDNNHFWIEVAGVDGASPFTRAALQYLRLNLSGKAFPHSEGINDVGLQELIKMLATNFTEFKKLMDGFDGAARKSKECNRIDLARSFVRLSCPDYKKIGGGYRVKRVEVYDNWKNMTTQKESVYGQTYSYTTTEKVDGRDVEISSGVATYEPAIGGEENPFRQPVSYVEQSAPMAPVNYMFSEEPLAESYFPAAMVGYSKVRVRTINAKARSANGWEETEFFTSRDYPTLVEHTLLEPGVSKMKYETTSNILRLNHKHYVTLSQGFKVELNDMNGKMKAQSSYAETDSVHPIAYSLNFYKTDNDKDQKKHLNNTVWAIDSVSGHIDTLATIGKDIEVMADLREQRSVANTRGFSPNIDIIPFWFPPFIPIPSKVNLPQKEDTRFRSAAMVKIVQRYGILDSVVVMDKGSVVSTKNILYDAETGNVVLSRTNNEFNDPVYNFNYPAYWAYSGMDLAYKNINAVFSKKGVTGGYQLNKGILYKEASKEPFPVNQFFESGDEVYVYSATKAEIGDNCNTLSTLPGQTWKGKLWVMEASRTLQKDTGLYFIDSLGRVAPNIVISKMMIIRSGKRNMPDVSAGNVVMLANPLKKVSDQYRVVIDSATKVINSSASTFKDLWRVDNTMYQQDSCYSFSYEGTDTLHPVNIFGNTSVLFRQRLRYDDGDFKESYTTPNKADRNFVTSSNVAGIHNQQYYRYSIKSVMKFDLASKFGTTDSIISSVLQLNPSAPTTAWLDVAGSPSPPSFEDYVNAHFQNGELSQRDNASEIYQVTVPWDLSTAFDLVSVSSGHVGLDSAGNGSCVDRSPNVTTFVRDLVKNPSNNYGFQIVLSDLDGDVGDPNNYERIMSYCTQDFIPHVGASPSGECVACNTSYLSVHYITQKDTCVKVCRKSIVDSASNPYRWGVLGNWRMERAYTYYNSRQEDDATTKVTNIRAEGTLKNFVPYWSFANTGITGSTDTTKWVWNSAISLFQKRGFEVENYDALGRYNAGLYGYNQTVPVAVAQNARYQEILFDGFEDYGFKTDTCIQCKPAREFDFLKGNSGVDTTMEQSHTGLYSLKINSGSDGLLTVPVTYADTLSKVFAGIHKDTIQTGIVSGTGTGLTGKYTMGHDNGSACVPTGPQHTRLDANVFFDWADAPPYLSGDCDGSYKVEWTGTIQPRFSDWYTFYFQYNGTATIVLDDTIVLHDNAVFQSDEIETDSIFLHAGSLHSISINYTKMEAGVGLARFSWSSAVSQFKEFVPTSLLYPVAPGLADTTGSASNLGQYICRTAATVRDSAILKKSFSPITNKQLTVSAWVRLNVEDCYTTPTPQKAIKVDFGSGDTTWLQKTGLRIEGWQRYEATVSVPSGATGMLLHLKPLSGDSIFVDDIRVQPFNSSMKSYVYNPTNMRLMADLDENNYATFYEYDDDGTLIRVKKETERGIMTIQETRSALLKDN